MARPEKKGLDYFPVDCDMDDNVSFIDTKHEHGFKVIIKLWRKCYKYEGYFTAWNDRTRLMFARENNLKVDELDHIIKDCFQEGVFSLTMFEKHGILTSSGVQRRYLKVVHDSKRKNCKISDNYSLLLNTTEETQGKHELTPELTPLTPSESTQSKVKYSIGKEIKQKAMEELKTFFGFNSEQNHIQKWFQISAFLKDLEESGKFETFIEQFKYYRLYKEGSGERIHNFSSFIDTGWDSDNWKFKYDKLAKGETGGEDTFKLSANWGKKTA